MVTSFSLRGQAHATLEGQLRLYEARLRVAEAQDALGETDIEDALAGARSANEAAERVHAVTKNIAASLEPTTSTARVIARAAARGLRGARFARRQTELASQLLAAISSYQSAARGYSIATNRALEDILDALRRTNENFPGTFP